MAKNDASAGKWVRILQTTAAVLTATGAVVAAVAGLVSAPEDLRAQNQGASTVTGDNYGINRIDIGDINGENATGVVLQPTQIEEQVNIGEQVNIEEQRTTNNIIDDRDPCSIGGSNTNSVIIACDSDRNRVTTSQ